MSLSQGTPGLLGATRSPERGREQILPQGSRGNHPCPHPDLARLASRTARESVSVILSSSHPFAGLYDSSPGKPRHPLPTSSVSLPHQRTRDFRLPSLSLRSLAFIPTEPIIRMLNPQVPIATALMPEPRITSVDQPTRWLRGGGREGSAEKTNSRGKATPSDEPTGVYISCSLRKQSAAQSPPYPDE